LLSLTPLPPPSPRVPYTTLFRSEPWDAYSQGSDTLGRMTPPPRRTPLPGCVTRGPCMLPRPRLVLHALRKLVSPRGGRDHPPLEDRKSTRLNSSHVKISYAVFCL